MKFDFDHSHLTGVQEFSTTGAITQNPNAPYVLRGVGANWPALQRWTFDHLAQLGGQRPVTLVVGNRELGNTRFVESTFGECLDGLSSNAPIWGSGAAIGHLKEFDLLKEFPSLRSDLDTQALFPANCYVSSSAWIGPKGAHTGMHYDLLNNFAVLLRGAKRFYLARPGVVEAQGALSSKYDRWARLANIGIEGLATRDLPSGSLFFADLHPGDAIHVPRGWWHEVVNLQSSIFLSGFYGRKPRVVGLWALTAMRQLLHDTNPLGRRPCTCHAGA